jgi:hypothetical protein
MFDLNILKIAGAFLAGVAGIIGILGHTRTQDNKLTRSGKWLFGMAVVGVVIAMATQTVSHPANQMRALRLTLHDPLADVIECPSRCNQRSTFTCS